MTSVAHEARPPPVPVPASTARESEDLAPLDRRTLGVAAAVSALLLALAGRYGYHRDELYFLDTGRHLMAGGVDQPVLVPLLARMSLALDGGALVVLRAWSAAAAGATVVVGALTARELGGGRTAQLVAAVGVATMPVLLGADHLFGTTAFAILAWAAVALLVVRLGRTGDPRWWVPTGAVLAVGLTAKLDIGLLAVALALGLVASGGARLLATRWCALGALLGLAGAAPDLWWQAAHGWPVVAMTRSLGARNGGIGHVPTWVVGQLVVVALPLVWLWVGGLVRLWRSGRPPWRALVWAYGLLFVLDALTTGAKVYYLAGLYVPFLAAGAVRSEGWLRARRRGTWVVGGLAAATTLVLLPVFLPVLPARDAGPLNAVNPDLGETIGWPGLVGTVARVWHGLPPDQRARAVIFTANYGEAGAVDQLGGRLGLPAAVSGHNDDWYAGPGDPRATTVVVVTPGPRERTSARALLGRECGELRTVATVADAAGVHNQEWGGHVSVCTRLRRPWGSVWPGLRHED